MKIMKYRTGEFTEVMKTVRDQGQVRTRDRTSNKGQVKTQYWLEKERNNVQEKYLYIISLSLSIKQKEH